MNDRLRIRAFTLLELMITLIIVGVLMSAGIITMRGYLPRQRLVASVSGVENLLQRAQVEASSRSKWTCIRFTHPTASEPSWVASLYTINTLPSNASSIVINDINFVCPSTAPLTLFKLKDGVSIISNSNAVCGSNGALMYFDTTGAPRKCAFGSATCVEGNVQLILTNSRLDTQAKAREIEALSTGLIKTVKPGEKGLDTTAYAAHPLLTDGCE